MRHKEDRILYDGRLKVKKNLLDAPIPPIFLQQRMFEEKLGAALSVLQLYKGRETSALQN